MDTLYNVWLPFLGARMFAILLLCHHLAETTTNPFFIDRKTLRKALRISPAYLQSALEFLELCGLLQNLEGAPKGIHVLPPPNTIPPQLREEFGPPDYSPLSTLFDPPPPHPAPHHVRQGVARARQAFASRTAKLDSAWHDPDVATIAETFSHLSGIPAPHSKTLRADWLASIRQLIEESGVELTIRKMQLFFAMYHAGAYNFRVTRPGSLVKTLSSYSLPPLDKAHEVWLTLWHVVASVHSRQDGQVLLRLPSGQIIAAPPTAEELHATLRQQGRDDEENFRRECDAFGIAIPIR